MKAFKFALFFGLVFPIVYIIASTILIYCINILFIPEGSNMLNQIVFFPIAWTQLLYDHIFETREMFEFMTLRWIIFFVGGNFLLYFIIGYLFWRGYKEDVRFFV